MPGRTAEELKKRITSLPDDELLSIVEENYADYRQEALDIATEELTRRNISFTSPPRIEPEAPNKWPVLAPVVAIILIAAYAGYKYLDEVVVTSPLGRIGLAAVVGAVVGVVVWPIWKKMKV
jgi:hypothetical protein